MHRIYRRGGELIAEASVTLRRCLHSSNLTSSKWNPVAHQRYFDLGRHVYEAFTISVLIDQYPEWNGAQIHDFTQGLSNSDALLKSLKSLEEFESSNDSTDFFARIGELQLKDGNSDELNQLLKEVTSLCISQTSDQDKQMLMKLQHPKYILQKICENKDNYNIGLRINKLPTGKFKCVAVSDNKDIAMVTADSLAEAEHLACQEVLRDHLSDEFEAFHLDSSIVFPPEESVNLEIKSPKQRQVQLTKTCDEPFGFTIRGGERKAIRNKQYIQLYITTPVFISLVEQGSPADRCGLQVGDVLLGVNDHSLEDCTHKQAVTTLRNFLNSESLLFTVKHSMKEVRKYEVEQQYLEREKEKIRDELSSEAYAKWHDAKAKQDPEQYLLEKLKDKKRPFKPKKHRQSLRLWDY